MEYSNGGRTKLPDETPLGVVTEESLFFITICSKNHGSYELLESSRAERILDAVRHRHESGVWYASIFLVMPDHVHGLIYFHNPDHPMEKAVTDFKRWTARGVSAGEGGLYLNESGAGGIGEGDGGLAVCFCGLIFREIPRQFWQNCPAQLSRLCAQDDRFF